MDLSGALLEKVILEVFDEEWVQTVEYEHIPFRCRKCHEHGHLFREFPLSQADNKGKTKEMKDPDNFQKVISREKGDKKGSRQPRNEGQKVSNNRYHVLEENAEWQMKTNLWRMALREWKRK